MEPRATLLSTRLALAVRLGFVFTRRACRSCAFSRSEEHTSELQSLMRISYAVFCLKKKKKTKRIITDQPKYIYEHSNNLLVTPINIRKQINILHTSYERRINL